MLNKINEQLFFLINGIANKSIFVDTFFIFITKVFVPVMILTVLFWFFVILPRRSENLNEKLSSYKKGSMFFLVLSILYFIIEATKTFVAFPRPQQLLIGVKALSTFGSYDSFPSAHTAFAFAVAIFVFYYSKTSGLILYFIALLVGISRIVVGVHFPFDVIFGAFIGMAVPWGIIGLFKRYTV